jgi:hypothetical protein
MPDKIPNSFATSSGNGALMLKCRDSVELANKANKEYHTNGLNGLTK